MSSDWQPIETAPDDQTEFQAWVMHTTADIPEWWEPKCRYNRHGAFQIWGRVDYDEDGWDCYPLVTPTHWMPNPEPPK